MATITAAEVKRLRDLTGTGMMECKKALAEAEGSLDRAVEILRISGAAKAAKRGAQRTASNGLVAQSGNALVEVRCETDFVAKSADFGDLAAQIAALADDQHPSDPAALAQLPLRSGETVAEALERLAAVIGEKLELGQIAILDGDVIAYLHTKAADLPPALGVLVSFTGDRDTAKTVAMQIAAMRPRFLTRDDVPEDLVESERRIAEATAREEGKPEGALPKIVEGRLNGFFKDVVLLAQPSVKESKKTVKAVLDEAGTTVLSFARVEVGEG
ncbi:MAG: translation elongation factor Ts [Candidatus Nanopelagicales bacterium]|nr:translation elongation factor Ts [Candidatus Nanopelagicales bacterium]MDZ4250734.1 translation elongation factor Ts [Candidatus Nanopelagicales bacterium]